MYRIGASHERHLLERFREKGYCGIRAAKSTSPDLIVGREGKTIAIECKYTTKKAVYIPREELEFLASFSRRFGCTVFVALKFGKLDWVLTKPEDFLCRTGEKTPGMKIEDAASTGLALKDFLADQPVDRPADKPADKTTDNKPGCC